MRSENNMKKLKTSNLIFMKERVRLNLVFYANKPMVVLMYKEGYFYANNLDSCVSSMTIYLLQEFDDVFPKEIPSGLLPIRKIER